MSQLINNNNNKKSLSSHSSNKIASTRRTSPAAGAGAPSLNKYPTIKKTTTSSLLSSNADVVSSSSSATSVFPMAAKEPLQLTHNTAAESGSGSGRGVFRTIRSFKIMSNQSIIVLLAVLACGLVTVNGLKCYMCGQYNEGVGSITPCLNYSEQYAHLYLKECSKKSEKYCVKYVSELSIVRDCATECAEKEIWETQTYCCTEDGCNGSAGVEGSAVVIILPLVVLVVNEVLNIIKQQRR